MSDVVDRVLDALNAHDLERFVACYTEDATIEDGDDKVIACGHDDVRERYGSMLGRYPGMRMTPLHRIEVGSFVVQHEQVTDRGDPERDVAVYLVRDGRIVRERLLA